VICEVSGFLTRASTSATVLSGVKISGWEVMMPPAVAAS
jgi:uncharacterized membrane protein YagU involved in acid resistance